MTGAQKREFKRQVLKHIASTLFPGDIMPDRSEIVWDGQAPFISIKIDEAGISNPTYFEISVKERY